MLSDYEKDDFYSISVRATDSGSPELFVDAMFVINVTDENDKPRNLDLSNENVRENAGASVGILSANDEDGDSVTYSLSHDDNEMFRMVDYEFSKGYNVTVLARDNGSPSLSVS